MKRLCRITVPELSMRSDFRAARLRMLTDFPNVHEVVATTAPGTLLVIYSGPDEADAWYQALVDIVAASKMGAPQRLLRQRGGGLRGGDSAA
jgi:hypothetical protein